MPGLPKATTGRADEFFRQLEQKVVETDRYVHQWDGELYLELHRGTYTSQAYVKKMNRYMEMLLRDTEAISIFNSTLSGDQAYPQKDIYDSWKIVLRNQFHDILPGSSITEVYEDCEVEYAEAEQLAQQAYTQSSQGLVSHLSHDGQPAWMIFNSLPWTRNEWVQIEWEERFKGKYWQDSTGHRLQEQRITDESGTEVVQLLVPQIPAMGYSVIRLAEAAAAEDSGSSMNQESAAAEISLEDGKATTPYYILEWNESGQLTRIYDKRTSREIIPAGEVGNRFDVHEDLPVLHDNWEIDIFYVQKVQHIQDLQSVEFVENSAIRSVIRFSWNYGKTKVKQDMILYPHNPRIDFSTWVDWQERETLLKVAFPVDVRATQATYEIQFGHVQRPTHWNTSWDYARFETCAHKWVDLSERGCGVSLLNDCKYGHDIKDNVMRITLIKSSNMPDPHCDEGEHNFTYALLPHEGDWFTAGTVEQAHRLNAPVSVVALPENKEAIAKQTLPDALSFITIGAPNIMIDTVKRAEDSADWIVRCYEYGGQRGEVELTTHFELAHVEEVNLAEQEPVGMEHESHHFKAFFKPFELKTFRLVIQD